MAAPGAAVLPFLVTGVQAGAGRGASARAGLPRVRIWERSPEKAEQLAAQVGAEAAPTESADVAHGLGKRRMAIAVYGSLRSLSTVLRGESCGK
jgi:ornithine cyclodeaminase/alanine dehydrogenase-like protein (mu-crystallin family)